MPKKPRLEVIQESESGLNKAFKDNVTGETFTRGKLADAIEQGKYPDYHVMKLNGKRIPRSNPDRNKNNNLE